MKSEQKAPKLFFFFFPFVFVDVLFLPVTVMLADAHHVPERCLAWIAKGLEVAFPRQTRDHVLGPASPFPVSTAC